SAIFGGIQLASSLGTGGGAWLAGAIYDATGSDRFAFLLAMAGAVLSGVCMWQAAPRKVRRMRGHRPPPAVAVAGAPSQDASPAGSRETLLILPPPTERTLQAPRLAWDGRAAHPPWLDGNAPHHHTQGFLKVVYGS
ncbi:MAG: hypothetical protein ACKVP6_13445, partial [Mycobacterium sp.]